jgi:hypothetical protein
MPEYSRSNLAGRSGDAFATWERETGRGWSVFEYETELEPTFSRFVFNRTTPPLIDDARVQNRIGRFFSHHTSVPQPSDPTVEKFVPANPAPRPAVIRKLLSIRAHLPNDSKALNIATEQMLLSLARSASHISFEIIATAAEVALQFSCPATEGNAVISHLRSHVPQIDFRVADDKVANNFGSSDVNKMVAVDFGLGKEWFTPLPFGGDFGIDPMTPLFSVLESLRNDEAVCLQILFARTRHEWRRSVQEVIFDHAGKPIFANLQNRLPAIKEKLSSPLLAVCIRLLVNSDSHERSIQLAKQTGVYLKQFSAGNQNDLFPLKSDLPGIEKHVASVLRRTTYRNGMLLTSRELSGIVRWPGDAIRSEKLKRDQNRTKAAPASATKGTIVLGENNHAGRKQIIRVSPASHSLLIGGTGTGKSTLLLNEIVQNIAAGHGGLLVDPHGDLVDEVMARVPDDRIRDVILFDPADEKFPIGFNILQANSETEKNFLASDLVATFRSYSTSWGDVMDSVLANAVLAFVESTRGGTLFDLKRFLVEKEFRREFLETVQDEAVRYFWTNEFPVMAGRTQSSVLIRLDSFLRQKLIRNIVCQTDSGLDLRRVLDERKILLVKLAQGLIGEQNAAFLGTLLISKLYQIALTRQDIDPSKRSLFPCFIDEAAHFVGNPSMSLILANLRKFGIALTLATQTYRQIRDRGEKDVAEAVLANCQTRICFRLGDNDAEKLAGGFSFFDAKALQNLGVGESIVRIERAEYDFNLKTYPPEPVEKDVADRRKTAIIEHTRQTYATPVSRVEDLLRITRELGPATRRGERSGVREGKATSFGQKDLPSGIVPSETIAAGNAADPGKGDKHHQTTKSGTEPRAASASTLPIVPTPRDRTRERSITTTPLPKAQPEIQADEIKSEHHYLQRLIKRIAEKYDFIATVEKPVLGGTGRIDVALEKGGLKVACEVAVTNTVKYEVQSIQKCISAGYKEVIVLSINETHLREIERAAKTTVSPGHFENVTFLKPDTFHLFLERLSAQAPEQSSDVKVKGYKILTSFADTTPSEAELIKETIVEILETEDRK